MVLTAIVPWGHFACKVQYFRNLLLVIMEFFNIFIDNFYLYKPKYLLETICGYYGLRHLLKLARDG